MKKQLVATVLASMLIGSVAQPASAVTSVKTQVTSTIKVSSEKAFIESLTSQMRAINTTVKYEMPSSMNVSNAFKKAVEADDYVNGVYAGASMRTATKNKKKTVTITIQYHHTKAQETLVTNYVKQKVATLVRSNMSDVEKIKVLHDDLIRNTTYSESANGVSVHSPYAIVKEGKGVCQAYALMMYRFLKQAGFEARYVTGESKGQGHAWNLVKLDGKWYHVDSTWDDPAFSFGDNDADYVQYDYFLVSEDVIVKDHTIDAGYPVASSENYINGLENMVSLVTYNDTPLMNLTNYVDGKWYFTDAEKDYSLTVLENGSRKSLIDDGVFVPTYANGLIYYIDARFSLNTYDIQSGVVTNTNLQNMTNIRKTDTQLLMYRDDEIVHTVDLDLPPASPESIVEDVALPEEVAEQTDADEALQYTQSLIDQLPNNLLYANFEKDAKNVVAAYGALTSQQKNALSQAHQTTLKTLQTKLKQYETFMKKPIAKGKAKVTFSSKKAWTFTLKSTIKNSSANRKKVVLYDQFGQSVAITVTIKGKKVTVTPKKGYVKGTTYVVHIPNSIAKQNGKAYNTNTYQKFVYKS